MCGLAPQGAASDNTGPPPWHAVGFAGVVRYRSLGVPGGRGGGSCSDPFASVYYPQSISLGTPIYQSHTNMYRFGI